MMKTFNDIRIGDLNDVILVIQESLNSDAFAVWLSTSRATGKISTNSTRERDKKKKSCTHCQHKYGSLILGLQLKRHKH